MWPCIFNFTKEVFRTAAYRSPATALKVDRAFNFVIVNALPTTSQRPYCRLVEVYSEYKMYVGNLP